MDVKTWTSWVCLSGRISTSPPSRLELDSEGRKRRRTPKPSRCRRSSLTLCSCPSGFPSGARGTQTQQSAAGEAAEEAGPARTPLLLHRESTSKLQQIKLLPWCSPGFVSRRPNPTRGKSSDKSHVTSLARLIGQKRLGAETKSKRQEGYYGGETK